MKLDFTRLAFSERLKFFANLSKSLTLTANSKHNSERKKVLTSSLSVVNPGDGAHINGRAREPEGTPSSSSCRNSHLHTNTPRQGSLIRTSSLLASSNGIHNWSFNSNGFRTNSISSESSWDAINIHPDATAPSCLSLSSFSSSSASSKLSPDNLKPEIRMLLYENDQRLGSEHASGSSNFDSSTFERSSPNDSSYNASESASANTSNSSSGSGGGGGGGGANGSSSMTLAYSGSQPSTLHNASPYSLQHLTAAFKANESPSINHHPPENGHSKDCSGAVLNDAIKTTSATIRLMSTNSMQNNAQEETRQLRPQQAEAEAEQLPSSVSSPAAVSDSKRMKLESIGKIALPPMFLQQARSHNGRNNTTAALSISESVKEVKEMIATLNISICEGNRSKMQDKPNGSGDHREDEQSAPVQRPTIRRLQSFFIENSRWLERNLHPDLHALATEPSTMNTASSSAGSSSDEVVTGDRCPDVTQPYMHAMLVPAKSSTPTAIPAARSTQDSGPTRDIVMGDRCPDVTQPYMYAWLQSTKSSTPTASVIVAMPSIEHFESSTNVSRLQRDNRCADVTQPSNRLLSEKPANSAASSLEATPLAPNSSSTPNTARSPANQQDGSMSSGERNPTTKVAVGELRKKFDSMVRSRSGVYQITKSATTPVLQSSGNAGNKSKRSTRTTMDDVILNRYGKYFGLDGNKHASASQKAVSSVPSPSPSPSPSASPATMSSSAPFVKVTGMDANVSASVDDYDFAADCSDANKENVEAMMSQRKMPMAMAINKNVRLPSASKSNGGIRISTTSTPMPEILNTAALTPENGSDIAFTASQRSKKNGEVSDLTNNSISCIDRSGESTATQIVRRRREQMKRTRRIHTMPATPTKYVDESQISSIFKDSLRMDAITPPHSEYDELDNDLESPVRKMLALKLQHNNRNSGSGSSDPERGHNSSRPTRWRTVDNPLNVSYVKDFDDIKITDLELKQASPEFAKLYKSIEHEVRPSSKRKL